MRPAWQAGVQARPGHCAEPHGGLSGGDRPGRNPQAVPQLNINPGCNPDPEPGHGGYGALRRVRRAKPGGFPDLALLLPGLSAQQMFPVVEIDAGRRTSPSSRSKASSLAEQSKDRPAAQQIQCVSSCHYCNDATTVYFFICYCETSFKPPRNRSSGCCCTPDAEAGCAALSVGSSSSFSCGHAGRHVPDATAGSAQTSGSAMPPNVFPSGRRR